MFLSLVHQGGPQGPNCDSGWSHSQEVAEQPHHWGEKIKPEGKGDSSSGPWPWSRVRESKGRRQVAMPSAWTGVDSTGTRIISLHQNTKLKPGPKRHLGRKL